MLSNIKLSQLASLISVLIPYLKPGAGDVALFGARILTLSIDPHEFYASEAPTLSSCTDVFSFVQTYELPPYYGFTPWPGHKNYLPSSTDLSTFVQTYELQLYGEFTPGFGYKDYLDPGPDSDEVVDMDQGVSSLTQEHVGQSVNINSVSNISAAFSLKGISTLDLPANTTQASVSYISATFSVNGIFTLPVNTTTVNYDASTFTTPSPVHIDAFSRQLMLPLRTTCGDFLLSRSGIAVDALNIQGIFTRDILVKNSSPSANRTILRVSTVKNNRVSKSSPAVKFHRHMQGGLMQRNRLNYPTDSDLCILFLVYMVVLLTFVTIYTYTPPKPRLRKCKRNKCGSAKKARARVAANPTPPAGTSL